MVICTFLFEKEEFAHDGHLFQLISKNGKELCPPPPPPTLPYFPPYHTLDYFVNLNLAVYFKCLKLCQIFK